MISRGPLGNLKTALVANISTYDLFGESKVSKIVRVRSWISAPKIGSRFTKKQYLVTYLAKVAIKSCKEITGVT